MRDDWTRISNMLKIEIDDILSRHSTRKEKNRKWECENEGHRKMERLFLCQ